MSNPTVVNHRKYLNNHHLALQSLKEFYEDQRGKYQSPTELEMRVYHRLIHIRDQKERHDDIPEQILSHAVFQLTTEFRHHVQEHSAPITKTSKLVVTDVGMQIFSRLAGVLNDQGSTVMVYLVACILERLFGKDTIDDIESLRSNLSLPEIIDGVSTTIHFDAEATGLETQSFRNEAGRDEFQTHTAPVPLKPSPALWPSSETTEKSSSAPISFTAPVSPAIGNAFAGLVTQPNAFGARNVFGPSVFSAASTDTAISAFNTSPKNVFTGATLTTAIPSVQTANTIFPDPASNQPHSASFGLGSFFYSPRVLF